MLDYLGRPVRSARRFPSSGNQIYEAATNRYNDTNGIGSWLYNYDSAGVLSAANWKWILSAGRFLFANAPIVRGALTEMADYSFPLEPQYLGADKEWGAKAEEWLWEWYQIANVKGPQFSGGNLSRMRLLGYKVDGDVGTAFIKSESGFPQLQIIRAHRIGTRKFDGELDYGPYAGMWIHNGCIFNDSGRTVAYLVLGESEDSDQWISARDLHLTFRPNEADQYRGVSHLVSSIQSFSDIKRLREYEMRAQQIGASISLIEKNETGTVDEAQRALELDGTTPGSDASGVTTKTYQSGLIQYYKANSGSGLEAFRNDRPSSDAQAFEDKIVSQALYGIGWDPNFALAIKEPGGAWARTVIQKIRRSIACNVEIERQAMRREAGWAVSVAIKLGLLPKPSDGDWFSWEFAPTQPQITADSGNEENAKRESYKLGLMTMRDLTNERGRWWEEERAQREVEVRDLLDRSKAIAKTYGISIQEAMNLIEQRTPNGAGTPPAQATTQEEGE